MTVAENLRKIKGILPEKVRLVAVSKTKTPESIMEAYNEGHRMFGENKAQELAEKYELLPKDIEWHMIGHLQTNKVKYIAPFVGMIHGVESLKLLKAIDKEAAKNHRVIPCLLQFYIATEETKFGLSLKEAKALLLSEEFRKLQNVKICGVMGMATYTDDLSVVRSEFRMLKNIFTLLKNEYFRDSPCFTEISMGMSDDYRIALEEGTTIVRIGSKIFGERLTQN